MRTFVAALLVAGGLAFAWQPAAAQGDRCVFQLDYVGGVGKQIVVGADTNYYGGGGVRFSCANTSVRMSADSVAYYGRRGAPVAEFVGHVKYEDSIVTMTADRGTYYRNGERWEARRNVVVINRVTGSTLTGPSLDYYRVVRGVRDTMEMVAVGRPTIRYVGRDSTGALGEPYTIVADRVRMRGEDQVWAAGNVTVDRSDFSARGDSLRLDSGKGQDGTLVRGEPVVKGLGRDSFELRGRQIDFDLFGQSITYVLARGAAHAISRDLDLVADTIALDIDADVLVQTIAWGDSIRPDARSGGNTIRGDSLAFFTPGQRLLEIRAFGRAAIAGPPDSAAPGAEPALDDRDWIRGDTVLARFMQVDSAGRPLTRLARLSAVGGARSFRRLDDQRRPGPPSLNYSRGDRITVFLDAEGTGEVQRVELRGHVDGVQLEPVLVTDSIPADSGAAPPKAPPPAPPRR